MSFSDTKLSRRSFLKGLPSYLLLSAKKADISNQSLSKFKIGDNVTYFFIDDDEDSDTFGQEYHYYGVVIGKIENFAPYYTELTNGYYYCVSYPDNSRIEPEFYHESELTLVNGNAT